MRLRLESERPLIVVVQWDSAPVPGEKRVERILVSDNESYHARSGATDTVIADPYFSSPKEQRFVVARSPMADRLAAVLREGPIIPLYGVGEISVDLDRIRRPGTRVTSGMTGTSMRGGAGLVGEVFHSGAGGEILAVEGRRIRDHTQRRR